MRIRRVLCVEPVWSARRTSVQRSGEELLVAATEGTARRGRPYPRPDEAAPPAV